MAKTFLGEEIRPETLGILYLCMYNYNDSTIKVVREIQFDSPSDALEAYANIHNPESQLAAGATQDKMLQELEQLHKNLNNPEWVKNLAEYL